jgi:hypothetical protein
MELDSAAKPTEVFGFGNCHDTFNVEFSGEAALYVTPLSKEERRTLRTRTTHKIHADINKEYITIYSDCIAQFIRSLEPIAISEDKPIVLHIYGSHACDPFDDDGALHIVFGSSPSGSMSTQENSVILDGHMFGRANEPIVCPGRTEGRGFVAEYGDFTIGQWVDSTYYLFLPSIENHYQFYLLGEENPFQKSLAYLWEAVLYEGHGDDTDDTYAICTEADFVSHLTTPDIRDGLLEAYADEMTILQERAALLQKQLADVLAIMRVRKTTIAGLEHLAVDEYDSAALWKRLCDHPLLDKVMLHGDVFHYYTKPVHIEDDDGRLRDIGSFVLRQNDFRVHIWAERTTHPERLAHPHIDNLNNSVCFGNIATELARLHGECKPAEAVLLCLDWLVEGYDPGLTYHKVEEWPLVSDTIQMEKHDA